MHNFLHMSFGAKALLAVAALVLIGTGVWYATASPKEGDIACTADAMQCPDGTYVGRSGPNCEFVCPTPATSGTTGSISGVVTFNSGIRGVAMAGPTCPVERDPPDPACADKPLTTNIVIYRATDSVRPVIVTTSNKEGKFTADLPPGQYVVRGGEAVMPRCTDTPVLVAASGYTDMVLECDTGIR